MTDQIPSFNLTRQNRLLKKKLLDNYSRLLDKGQFIMGESVKQLEREVAGFLGSGYGIGVGNGSDALYLALKSCGIIAGDEVITTPFTFYATAGSIERAGARPIFVDIDPETWNIDPALIEERITPRTRAIMPVHIYGCPADMDPVMELAQRHNLKVIEDAAQSLGALYRGKKAGSMSDAGCLSFFPTKNLGAFGDGGMVVTGNPEIAGKVQMLRVHGAAKKYYHDLPGVNSRLDEIQAAVLRVKLPYLERWTGRRREIASLYNTLLAGAAGKGLQLPIEPDYAFHVYHQYTVQTASRDKLKTALQEQGISSTVYYPLPLHRQEVFASLGYREGEFPVAERASREVLSLPMFPELTNEEVSSVARAIEEFFS